MLTMRSPAFQARLIGRAALDHVHDVDAVGIDAQLWGRLCIGHGQIGDAQVGTAGDVAVLQQILCHLDGIIDGDGKAQTLGIELEEDFALTMPTSSPFMLNRPPPELPGLTEASIWIRDMVFTELVP